MPQPYNSLPKYSFSLSSMVNCLFWALGMLHLHLDWSSSSIPSAQTCLIDKSPSTTSNEPTQIQSKIEVKNKGKDSSKNFADMIQPRNCKPYYNWWEMISSLTRSSNLFFTLLHREISTWPQTRFLAIQSRLPTNRRHCWAQIWYIIINALPICRLIVYLISKYYAMASVCDTPIGLDSYNSSPLIANE